ncbi:MAG TPA: MarR family transcriptional regulator [Candidatus Eisenbacteria bacterium]|nr:MarR family transcriptional regulator [Candidatus Eisenbacteria bacterium]
MPKLTSSKAEKVWEGISRAHCSMLAALEKDMLPKTGIPLAWYQVLAQLSHAPDNMLRFQDLARVAGISESGASRRLNQMLKAGLIDRHSCPTDRRGVYAHLTAKGNTAYEKGHAVFLRSLDRHLGTHMEADEADVLRATLARLS